MIERERERGILTTVRIVIVFVKLLYKMIIYNERRIRKMNCSRFIKNAKY